MGAVGNGVGGLSFFSLHKNQRFESKNHSRPSVSIWGLFEILAPMLCDICGSLYDAKNMADGHVHAQEKLVKGRGHVGVSKNKGTPKWMVYNGKPYQNGWFGGTTIFGNTHVVCSLARTFSAGIRRVGRAWWILFAPRGFAKLIPRVENMLYLVYIQNFSGNQVSWALHFSFGLSLHCNHPEKSQEHYRMVHVQ